MEKKITCTICPKGCLISIFTDKENKIEGYSCKKGYEFAKQEIVNPLRVLTTTVRLLNSEEDVLPVKTNKPIPKDKIFDCVNIIRKIKVQAPVIVGQVIIKNILDTGADVVATRNINAKD